MERVILHSDMNNFYASVECLHRPELRDKPVVVGGDPELRHGIVLAKNGIAKRFGIKTGEALWQAQQKCKGLVVVPPNFPLYLRFSQLARQIYEDYTDQIEPFGIDEAWLDVTGSIIPGGDGEKIANEIRRRIKFELGVTVSIGVSFNKIFAKLGSDLKKPDAVSVISRENYMQVAWPLPAGELLYVGSATRRKLQGVGLYTIGDIATAPPQLLKTLLGKWGEILQIFARGEDTTHVSRAGDESVIKSIGNSTTTPRDLVNDEDVKMVVYVLAESVAARMREHGFKAKTVTVNVRDNQLTSVTRQCKTPVATNLADDICKAAMELFHRNYRWINPIRSIGVSAADFVIDSTPMQLDLYDDARRRDKLERIDRAADDLRRRFGTKIVQRAVLLQDSKLTALNPKDDHIIHPVSYF